MKKNQSVTFSKPEMKINRFEANDVMTASMPAFATSVSVALFGKAGAVNVGGQSSSYWN